MDIRLSPEQRRQLEAIARGRGMSLEQATHELLESALSTAAKEVASVNGNSSSRASPTERREALADEQHAAIDRILERMGELPAEPGPDDGLSGRDHDQILYGKHE